MLFRILVVTVLLFATTLSLAARPNRANRAGRNASTTQAATTQKFPTPDELFAKLKKLKADSDAATKVAYFNLSDPVQEKPADFSLFSSDRAMTLRSLLQRLRDAGNDKSISAVLITLSDTGFNLAQAQEIQTALAKISKTKRTFVYADAYDTAGYIAATGATDICILGGGEILIPGVGLETTFAKGTLDKIGVQADYIQIGEFKGADEQFTRTEPSPELRGELNKLLDSLYGQIVSTISDRRKLGPDVVKSLLDQAMITGKTAKERGLVDHTVDVDGLRELIAGQLGVTKKKSPATEEDTDATKPATKKTSDDSIELVHDYGRDKDEEPDMSNPFAFFTFLMKKPEVSDKPAIALIYADGVIVDGEGRESLFGGGGVGSEDMRKALRMALRDDQIKAVVIRIDSPGGSALASEAMWQSARRLAKEKPLIISIGSMAASGGYYLASAGDTIFADPTAIVGSIGVVGGKFVLKDLFGKIGLSTESFTRGKNASLFSSTHPFDEQQRAMVTAWMKETYTMFTERVMETRKGKIQDIDQVARGRIFTANMAKDLGMVDTIGGIDDAITFAAGKANLEDGDYDVRTLPPAKTFADLISGGSEAHSPAPGVESFLAALPRSVRSTVTEQLQILHLLAQRPVILVTPYRVK